jgi:hypothetical protein
MVCFPEEIISVVVIILALTADWVIVFYYQFVLERWIKKSEDNCDKKED